MRWSIEELIKDLKIVSNSDYGFWYRLTHIPQSLYRQTRSLFYWVFTGYGYTTACNTGKAIVNEIVAKLKSFRKLDKKGYPIINNIEDVDDWNNFIDSMITGIEGFDKVHNNEDAPDNPFRVEFFKLMNIKDGDNLDEETVKLKAECVEYTRINLEYYKQLMSDFVKAMEKLTINMIDLWD